MIIVVVGSEGGSRLLFYLDKKNVISHNIFKSEVFSIRYFTKQVHDGRSVTLKKNFLSEPRTSDLGDWVILTDANGFRIPKKQPFKGDISSSSTDKKLFIGDSVPFGWGVNASDSIPQIFQQLDTKSIILNGAVPSTSFSEAISRLEIEFRSIPSVKSVYLQTYDPAIQYGLGGSGWKEGLSWTYTAHHFVQKVNCKIVQNEFLNKNSKLVFLVNRVYQLKSKSCKGPEMLPFTLDSDERYINHIINELKKVSQIVRTMNATLYVAPIVTRPNIKRTAIFTNRYKHTIELMNRTIEDQADNLDYVFVPLEGTLSYDDFIDNCCHLSKDGATKVAATILSLGF